MRIPFPASRTSLRLRLSFFDVICASITPFLALYLSDAYVLVLASDGRETVALYCAVSAVCSILVFLLFRLEEGVSRYFSVHDALNICKAVGVGEVLTIIALFAMTRLEGIPRSAPIIHALLLAVGLVTARFLVRMRAREGGPEVRQDAVLEHIVMIGATRFTALYIKFLDACDGGRRRVVAVLDTNPSMIGRSIAGVRIAGTPQQLQSIIDEYVLHGIEIDRVLVGGERDCLAEEELQEISRVCRTRQIGLSFVPQLIGLNKLKPKRDDFFVREDYRPPFVVPRYFRLKYVLESCAALTLIVALLPLFIGIAAIVLLEIGSPALFWQQRIGARGRRFLLYKFRTMRAPFDRNGNVIPSEQRLTRVGRLLRETSLDELPQLFNVLVGDMSLIGPRPLLPEDQPANSVVRLLVRPGITGWAQINGRKDVTPAEKEQLDEWYIRNGSLGLDLRIAFTTLKIVMASATSRTDPASGNSSAHKSQDIRPIDPSRLATQAVGSRPSYWGNVDRGESTNVASMS
jgi:lipopolysaccharide/colanic/teichoic acid biosynthesis glycosyltransferase